MKRYMVALTAVSLVAFGILAWAVEQEKVTKERTEQAQKKEPFYGNPNCPIMGGKVDPKLFVEYKDAAKHTYGKIYMCCPGCKEKIEKDAAAIYKKMYLDREIKDKDGKVIVKKGELIDLKNPNCPVMGGKVSGKDFVVYNGYKVRFCCPGCEAKFIQDADKNLLKLITTQKLAVPGCPEGCMCEKCVLKRSEAAAQEPAKK